MKLKQVIILRKDLNMRKGKMIAQGSHASIKAILSGSGESHGSNGHTITPCRQISDWLYSGQTKICVSVDSEQELLDLYEKVKDTTELPCSLVQDYGLTEFNGVPTYTAVAVGPGPEDEIDPITGHLKLL